MYRKVAERNSGRSSKGRTAVLSLIVATIILTNCLVLLILPEGSAADSGQCGDDLTWDYDPDTRNLTISGTGEMWNDQWWPWLGGTFEIETIEIGSGVTSIGDYAFMNRFSLTSVSISDSVEYIGVSAFDGCESLAAVNLPSSLKTIGDYAFYFCGPLTSVDIPDSVEYIGEYAFYETSLTTVNIPASVTSIGNSVFDGCESLESINVDESNPNYSSQDGVLFDKEKTKLIIYPTNKTGATFTIPDTVTEISNNAFYECTSLTSMDIPDSVETIGRYAFCSCTSLTSVDLSSSLKTIGKYAFYECTSLTSMDIPDSVEYIGGSAFANCHSLTSVDIPASVTVIEHYTFNSCNSLESINIDESNPNYSSQDGVLFDKAKTNLITYPRGKTDVAYTIPDSVTNIAESSFADNDFLTSVVIPDSVTNIGFNAFYGCDGLTSVFIPASVSIVDNYAFAECKSLTAVTIEGGTTYIYDYTFKECSSLESIDVGSENTRYSSEDGVLFDKTKTKLITYPAGKTDTEYTAPATVTSLANNAFENNRHIESVTLPNGLKTIGTNAFCECVSLESVNLPATLTTINANAFSQCVSLKSVSIPASVTTIGYYVFYNCESLESIDVDESNTKYCSEDGVLFNKAKTILIAYPGGKTDSTYAVPASVTDVEMHAFLSNMHLASIEVDESNTAYCSEDGVLFDKTKTKLVKYPAAKVDATYTIPSSVTEIESGAFKKSENLMSIEVEEGNMNFSSVDGCVLNSNSTTLQICPPGRETYTFSPGITRVNPFAFTGDKLKEISTSESSSVSFSGQTVWDCQSLERIVVANGSSLSINDVNILYLDTDKHTITIVCPEDFKTLSKSGHGDIDYIYERYSSGGDPPDAPVVDPSDDPTGEPDDGGTLPAANGWELWLYVIITITEASFIVGLMLIVRRYRQ